MDDAARAKAEFCLALRIAPSEYDRLSPREVRAFVKVQERINRLKNKK